MKSWTRALGITVGAAALVLSGIGIAAARNSTPRSDSGRSAPATPRHAATAPTPNTTANESVMVPLVPCRIVDTRLHGGHVKSARAFLVGGTAGFTNQGGASGGCGIPVGAVAIAANIVAVDEVKNGFVKAWPTGTTAPNASVLNFQKGIALANQLTLSVNPGTASALDVSASQKTQIVIDVTGYYELQTSADIESGGGFFNRTARVLSVTHTVGSGLYQVFVDHLAESCSAQVTPLDTGNFASAVTESPNRIDVRIWHLVSGVVTLGDDEFNFTLVC